MKSPTDEDGSSGRQTVQSPQGVALTIVVLMAFAALLLSFPEINGPLFVAGSFLLGAAPVFRYWGTCYDATDRVLVCVLSVGCGLAGVVCFLIVNVAISLLGLNSVWWGAHW